MLRNIKEILFRPTVLEEKFDNLSFNIVLFDLFFLPLFPWFSVSISLPVLTYWYYKRHRRTCFVKEHRYFSAVIVLMIVSTLLNPLDLGTSRYGTTFFYAVKTFFMFVTGFWYYFFFVYMFKTYKRNINNVIFYGLVNILLFAIYYSMDMDGFVNFKRIVCPFDPQVNRWLDGGILDVCRYNYLWADPNNVAYATASLLIFYISNEKDHLYKKLVLILISIYIIICTMSMGGLAVSIVCLSYVLLFTKSVKFDIVSTVILALIAITVVIYGLQYFDYFMNLIDSGILSRAETYGADGIASGGGRMDDLKIGISNMNPLFLILGSGREGFVTEIGHLHTIGLYGVPVYIYFIYVYFWKKPHISIKEYIPIIPFFVGYSINIAIIEQKFMLLSLLISAYLTAISYDRGQLKKMQNDQNFKNNNRD